MLMERPQHFRQEESGEQILSFEYDEKNRLESAMPLLDHFHPPINNEIQWNLFYSNWSTRIADRLMELMPDEFRAHEKRKRVDGIENLAKAARTTLEKPDRKS